MMYRVDRFTFETDSSVFVELASEEEAKKAIEALDGQKILERSLKVNPLSETFYWDSGFKKDQRIFFYDKDAASQAVQGLIDGRRYRFYVENPGWVAAKNEGISSQAKRREIVMNALAPFGVEALGRINPIWNSDRRSASTILTVLDFETKEGAERAVEALNDQIIEGKRVQLKPFSVSARRAEQIGKLDKNVLAQLQQHGISINGDFQIRQKRKS